MLLQVRKRDANTVWVARELARRAGCRPADVGYAGLKDRRALRRPAQRPDDGRCSAGSTGFGRCDLAWLHGSIMTGASCPIPVMRMVVCEAHMREVTICYGMRETSPVSFQRHVDDPIDKRISTAWDGCVHLSRWASSTGRGK